LSLVFRVEVELDGTHTAYIPQSSCSGRSRRRRYDAPLSVSLRSDITMTHMQRAYICTDIVLMGVDVAA
jgi:hypothetical protein